jgi:hypothetical protein
LKRTAVVSARLTKRSAKARHGGLWGPWRAFDR